MRRLIVDHVDHGGGGLEPAALKAVHLLKVAPADGVERALEHSGASSPARRPGDDAG